ncbi:DNA recombination protein RecF [Nonlabens sp. MIC269]|uniref:DNA replication/repair protein RecF n=1 Tax=Nonlabens sp. MIC269 TaxID=1476901 RepID=UPI0007202E6E|nr:DNA replication/repair protein RecF [Nonlabens sp. MIC269]ALM22105.1 DNA recombination protein RecF [Nonlabens sp. MIC269]
MHLTNLHLINYKSFEAADFDLDERINCFVGKNGIGKTNVLDAIYHLALTKSYFNPITVQNIKHGEEFFVISGEFLKNEQVEKITVSAKRGNKKVVKRNGKIYDKLSEHIGLIPVVIISPADRDLITEGSDTRRKFLDSVISLENSVYFNNLIKYNKLIQQRNALLKYFAANRKFDSAALQVYDEQLIPLVKEIHLTRVEFLEQFLPIFKDFYAQISSSSEEVTIHYKSDLHNTSAAQLFTQAQQKDMHLQYTSVGVHKDDLIFTLQDHPIKKYGSQGQQKSFLTALKLAQFQFIKERSGVTPILLLDDIFDKLDENRVSQLINMVNDDRFGQIFISDTHTDRTEAVIKTTDQSYKIFEL